MQPIIIFESMSKLDVVWACFSALIGRRVLYIKKPRRTANPLLVAILRKRFFRKRIRRIRIVWKNDYFDGMWGDRAFSVINDVYAKLNKKNFVKNLLKKFGLAAELSIKKELTTQLSRFFYLNELLGCLSDLFDSKIIFVPASGLNYVYYTTSSQEALHYTFLWNLVSSASIKLKQHQSVSFSKLVRMRGFFLLFSELFVRHFRMVSRTIKGFCIAIKNILYPKANKLWKYGVMIICDRQFWNDIEGLDFLIDGKHIKKEEIVFIRYPFVHLGSRELAYIRRKNLNFINNLYDYYSIAAWIEVLRSYFLIVFTGRPFLLKVAQELCLQSAVWKSFSSRVHLDNIIGHHDVSISALCRNIILEERQGTQSWMYIDSIGYTVFFAPDDGRIRYKVSFFSFLCYNHVVCWNKKTEEMFLELHNKVDVYYCSGCLWSTFIKRQMTVSKCVKNNDIHTIAVFDSTYFDYSISNTKCAYYFYKGILRLLNSTENIRIIIKQKKSRRTQELLYDDRTMFCAIDRLIQHPRCKTVDYTKSRAEIITQVDLVIAYPFTSPAFEAVCAGMPAIYFDANGAFPGSRYQICGMVASGYDELVKKVEYFLSLPKDDFYKWRIKYQSIFDEYLDGQGLDRFIKKLAGVI